MDLRTFMRFHFLKVLLGVIVIQLVIIVIVQNYNHKPVAERDTFSVIENRTLMMKPLVNDTDKNKDTELEIKNVFDPHNGIVGVDGKRISYTPNKDFVGMDSIGYTCTDGKKESEVSYVVIEVQKNMPPVGANDEVKAYVQKQVNISPMLNDKDNEGDSIFIKDFTIPVSGKVTFNNNTFTYLAGNTALIDSFSYTLSDGKSTSAPVWVRVNVLGKDNPQYPWYYTGVGNFGVEGEFSVVDGNYNIKASGSDIWGNADGFSYVYQSMKGSGMIMAKIESYNSNQEWARAGIMIREDFSAGSKNYFIGITAKHGICNQGRPKANAATEWWYGNAELTAPCWLKIIRNGNQFKAYTSKDGTKWDKVNEVEIDMAKDAYVGFSVTNQNSGGTCDALFSNVRFKN